MESLLDLLSALEFRLRFQRRDCLRTVLAKPSFLRPQPFLVFRQRPRTLRRKCSAPGDLASLPIAMFINSGISARKALK